jgi:hypothetical protein
MTVKAWLRQRIYDYRKIQSENPWTSGNDGVHDDAERRC